MGRCVDLSWSWSGARGSWRRWCFFVYCLFDQTATRRIYDLFLHDAFPPKQNFPSEHPSVPIHYTTSTRRVSAALGYHGLIPQALVACLQPYVSCSLYDKPPSRACSPMSHVFSTPCPLAVSATLAILFFLPHELHSRTILSFAFFF